MTESDSPKVFDALILGGGPAGLAAAVYLGRYLRSTLILDEKKPQTRWHRPIAHNVLGFPAGIHRNQLLDWGRSHIAKYGSVKLHRATARFIQQIPDPARRDDFLFQITDTDEQTYRSRGLLLAAGVEYELPDIPDIIAYAGHTIWHCPECDGYKCIGKKIALLGHDRGTAEMALNVSIWTNDITIITLGHSPEFDEECLTKLRAANIRILTSKITAIRGNAEDGILESFQLDDGTTLPAFGAFANQGCSLPEGLFKQLPLEFHKNRWIKVDYRMRTNIPRCYAAGDVIAHAQTQLSVAMGCGAAAAIWLHKELLPDNLCLSGRQW